VTTNKTLQMGHGVGFYGEIVRQASPAQCRFYKRQLRRTVRRNKDFLDDLAVDMSPGAADFLLPEVVNQVLCDAEVTAPSHFCTVLGFDYDDSPDDYMYDPPLVLSCHEW
jgi:hypothetical protein